MRSIKIAGLATIAALAVMALVGAASASATTICSATDTSGNTAPCASGWKYGTDIAPTDTFTGTLYPGSQAVLTSNNGTVRCNASTVSGTATSSGVGQITGLTFSSCRDGSGIFSCTVTVNSLPYNATVTFLSDASNVINGTLTVSGSIGVHISCAGGFVTCDVTASSVTLNLYNPHNTAAPHSDDSKAEAQALNVPLNGCGGNARWNAVYNVVGNNPSGNILHIEA